MYREPSPFLPWRALFAYTPAFWLESARTVRSPGERPITHLNNHKENAEFPGTLAQVKLLPVSHRPPNSWSWILFPECPDSGNTR